MVGLRLDSLSYLKIKAQIVLKVMCIFIKIAHAD